MQLKRKQTSLLIITVLASLVFIWQLIILFTQDIAAAPPKAPETALKLATPTPVITEKAVTKQTATFKLTPDEKQYTDLLHRYQVAKLEHQLLQEEVAIARMQSHLNKIQTNPHARNQNEQTGHLAPNDHPVLKFLAQQHGIWHALVLWKNEWIKLQKLQKNQSLTGDWTLIDINHEGVILMHEGRRYLLSFDGLSPLENSLTIPPSNSKPNSSPKLSSNTRNKTQDKINPMTELKTSPITPVNVDMLSLDHTILLSMPARSYTLILASDQNPQRLLALAKRHHLSHQTFLYRHHDDESTGYADYSLVYGEFLSKRAADHAIGLLKEQAPALNPQVTLLSEVQRSIKGLSP